MERVNIKGYTVYPFKNKNDAEKSKDTLYPDGNLVRLDNDLYLIQIKAFSYADIDGVFHTTKELI